MYRMMWVAAFVLIVAGCGRQAANQKAGGDKDATKTTGNVSGTGGELAGAGGIAEGTGRRRNSELAPDASEMIPPGYYPDDEPPADVLGSFKRALVQGIRETLADYRAHDSDMGR